MEKQEMRADDKYVGRLPAITGLNCNIIESKCPNRCI